MSVWLARAGRNGEQQDLALEQSLAVIGWSDVPDLSKLNTRDEVEDALRKNRPNAKPNAIANWQRQFWAFSKTIKKGDLIILPLKGQSAIAIGEVTGDYKHRPDLPEGAKHTRPVKWLSQDIPRDRFEQDLLYSFGAFMAVCQIKRNNAEERIKAILNGRPAPVESFLAKSGDEDEDLEQPDLVEYAQTQIRTEIGRKFIGHKMAELVEAILRAQGYHTLCSPPGPDGGVDIQAGRGPMGFESPRLLVQVKSGKQQLDVRVFRELQGVMGSFNAEHGLLVSWGGFRRSVHQEARRQFFQIKLWDADDVVDAILKHYEQLPEDLKAELPLKRIWILVREENI